MHCSQTDVERALFLEEQLELVQQKAEDDAKLLTEQLNAAAEIEAQLIKQLNTAAEMEAKLTEQLADRDTRMSNAEELELLTEQQEEAAQLTATAESNELRQQLITAQATIESCEAEKEQLLAQVTMMEESQSIGDQIEILKQQQQLEISNLQEELIRAMTACEEGQNENQGLAQQVQAGHVQRLRCESLQRKVILRLTAVSRTVSIPLTVFLTVSVSTTVSVCLTVSLPVALTVALPVALTGSPCVSHCVSHCVCLSLCLSLAVTACLSLCLSLWLSLRPVL